MERTDHQTAHGGHSGWADEVGPVLLRGGVAGVLEAAAGSEPTGTRSWSNSSFAGALTAGETCSLSVFISGARCVGKLDDMEERKWV